MTCQHCAEQGCPLLAVMMDSYNRTPGSRLWCALQDSAVELSRLVPPFKGASGVELGYLAGQTLLPIDVEGDRQYFLSIPHGRILQKDLLLKVLKGELDGEITQ